MKLKKILALICVFAMTINFAVYAENDTVGEDNSSDILLALGVIDEVSNLQKEVTRCEFASLMADMFNVSWDTSHAKTSFIDVSEKHANYGDICWLLDRGAIAKVDMFEPDRSIMMSEAVKIMVSLLGYDQFAMAQGGYPSGYIAQAHDKDILDGITLKENDALKFTDAYKMMTSMLESEPFDTSNRYSEAYQKTLMYYNFNARKVEGIVTSDGITAIKGTDVCADNCIAIENTTFEIEEETSFSNYVGYNVQAYVYNKNNTDTLCYITPYDNEVVEIKSSDVDEIEDKTVKFDENDKPRKIKLNTSIEFIYNDMCETFRSYEELIPSQGKIVFIDNNNDGKYDVVKTYKYEDMVISYNDTVNNKLFDNARNKEIDLNNVRYTVTKNGDEIDVAEIEKENILTYYSSLDASYITIMVTDEIIEGTVKSAVTKNDRTTLTIDDKKYEVADDCNFIPEVGYKGEFKLNTYGDVVQVDLMFGEGNMFGYVINGYLGDARDKYYVKMFTSNGFIEEMPCAKKITLDGNKKVTDMSQLHNALCTDSSGNNTGEIVRQPIEYKMNSNNEITFVDTLQTGTYSQDDRLSLDKSGRFLYSGSGVFANTFGFDTDSTIMIVTDDDNEDAFRRINSSSFTVDRSYTVKAYNLSSETGIAELLIADRNNMYIDSVMFVEEVTTDLLDEEIMLSVSGYVNGAEASSYFYPDTVTDAIEPGDVIKISTDYKIRQTPVKLYDYSSDTVGSVSSSYNLIKGRVQSVYNDYVFLNCNGEMKLYNLSGKSILRYDTQSKEFAKSSSASLRVGEEIIIHMQDYTFRSIVVYE